MTPFRRPAQGPGTPRVSTNQPAGTLVRTAAKTSTGLDASTGLDPSSALDACTGLDASTGLDAGPHETLLMAAIKTVPKHRAGRLGLAVTAAVLGTVITLVLNVPPHFRMAAAAAGAALPAFMTEPGPRQRQRVFAACLVTAIALVVTYAGATVFSYITGKQSVYLSHPRAPATPWTVIKAYYNDITAHDYEAAWRLKGPSLHTQSYADFAAGFAATGRQTVSKLSMSGDRVSFTLRSDNPDGTVQTYHGTDTVTGGKIVAANVVQTGGPAQP